MKIHSTFFNEDITSLIRENLKTNKAAFDMAARFIDSAEPWMNMTYDELADMIFSSTLKRSWFVRSDGSCPSCNKSVPMYNWIYDPFELPWKMKCPHCSELFPKNDFAAYYKTGLDEAGVFHHAKADKSLLINENGTDFGVDDGNGWFDEKGLRYMFIGAYLSHSQWRSKVITGIETLALSYVLSGNAEYAVRAGIILNSISRFWPEYDFYTQGIMYEQEFKSKGYVNYWVDSNREVRIFAIAYDQIFSGLTGNAKFNKLINKSFTEFNQDVESRIFTDSLINIEKISTNPPATPHTVAIIKSVLCHPESEIAEVIETLISDATLVDGLSGESGLGGYAAIAPRAIADLLCLFTNTDANFIEKMLERYPQLYSTFRFHIDTWYDSSYYPGIGDSSVFALPMDNYTALFNPHFTEKLSYHRSREWFIMKLSNYYNDPDMAKTIYKSFKKTKGCFDYDIYISQPSYYEHRLEKIIAETGSDLIQKSTNFNKWRISILHTGCDENKTMLAIPYDSGKNHSHMDALSLHLFTKGINITPDYGYPPVNHGGWLTKEAKWYRHPAAHNQLVIDGQLHTNMPPDGDGMFYRYPEYGQNILFADTSFVKATYNCAPEYNGVKRNERLTALIDISDSDFYCIDISRTEGGNSHSRFLHGPYSEISSNGLNLKPGHKYYPDQTIMRNHMTDSAPEKYWSADWKAYSDSSLTPLDRDIHMKYTSLTDRASVTLCESWVDITRMVQTSNIRTGNKSVWIPTLYETLPGPRSQISGIIEIYEDTPLLSSVTESEIQLNSNFDKSVKVIHSDGTTDYIIANDPESENSVIIKDIGIETDALLAVIRYKSNKLVKAIVCAGSYLRITTSKYTMKNSLPIIEWT